MAKNWYPIINYDNCIGCMSCVNFCPHGVFEKKDNRPVVAHPEDCVEFCQGCQKGACDSDAINYFKQ
jgi:NAD-dependent dihydropyrimidine dehydrogenase PreA subunit